MRKFLIPLTAAASALAFAMPASAQYYPQPRYAAPHAYNSVAIARSMDARVQNLRIRVRDLDRRNLLTRGQARSFDSQARSLQRQIARSTRYGLTVRERVSLDSRIVRLEHRVHQRVALNMRHGNRSAYGYGRRW